MKIENPKSSSSLFFFCLCFFCVFVVLSKAIESPQFSVVHSESDFEIRLYRDSSWMSAPVQEISFEKATKQGFHRLYQYIHGDNLDSSELKMTAPVLTSITSGAHKSEYYYVRYYVSTKFQGTPPHPLPELNLQFSKWVSHCVAVRMFSGYATDDTISKEVEALVTSLSRLQPGDSATLVDRHAYTVAQYNASFHASGRLNEVWMDVSGVTKEGLFQYIQGANLNSSRIRMTAPVLTSIVPEAGPLHSSAYVVRFYLPVKFQATPPLPLPELNLHLDARASHCIAVRKFSGFAKDNNIIEEAEKLALSLSKSKWRNSTSSDRKYAYSIAQYNSPFRFIGRVNEAWVDIDGVKTEDCQASGVAAAAY